MPAKKRSLSVDQRLILEANGVIDAPRVPRSDLLEAAIRARGYGLRVAIDARGFAQATVTSAHGTFDGAGDHADVAIVEALCAALAARPQRAPLFDDGGAA